MKKRFVKGVLAATLALATVLSVPQGSFLGAKSDNTITAHAACSHNYRHYPSWGPWFLVKSYYWPGGLRVREERRYLYSTCVNCGHMGTILDVQNRKVYGD